MTNIEKFWAWFEANENRIAQEFELPTLWDEIDKHLSEISPRFGWEIGPVDATRMYFAVSPDLQEDLVAGVSEVISKAYLSKLWDFRLGRQRRPWSAVLMMASDRAMEKGLTEIDVSKWRHIAYRIKDSEKLDIVFESGGFAETEEGSVDEVAALVAVGLLGEMVVMQRVDIIEVQALLDAKANAKAKPAEWLPYAFGLKPL